MIISKKDIERDGFLDAFKDSSKDVAVTTSLDHETEGHSPHYNGGLHC